MNTTWYHQVRFDARIIDWILISNDFSTGLYMWPFEVTFPDPLFATGEYELASSEGPEVITTFLKISASIGGKTEEVKLSVSAHDGIRKPQFTRTLSSPKIKFLVETPFMPDDDPQPADTTTNSHNSCLKTLPSTGLSSDLRSLFNPSHSISN